MSAFEGTSAPFGVNHKDVPHFNMDDAFLGISRARLAVDHAHGFFLESGLNGPGDAYDRLDALLVACSALLDKLHTEMAVECGSSPTAG